MVHRRARQEGQPAGGAAAGRPVDHLAGDELHDRRPAHRRLRAARPGGTIRLGRRLPRRDEGTAPGVLRGPVPAQRTAGRDAHIRRRRPHERPRGGGARRRRLVRKEHQHPEPDPRLLDPAGQRADRPGAGARPAVGQELRRVRSLYRRLSDRRDRRALRDRQPALHLVLDDRAPRVDTPGAAAAGGRLGIRVRHLPGRCAR